MTLLRLSLLSLLMIGPGIGCGGKTTENPGEDRDTGSLGDSVIDSFEPIHDDGPFPDSDLPPPDAPIGVATDKLDLLFVVDNSISMADKQAELARAIPGMLRDLTVPDPTGAKRAFASVHVGVITSSLGSHGTSACAVEITSRSSNDAAHLLPRTGEGGGSGYALGPTGMITAAPCPTPVAASALRWAFDPTKDMAEFYGSSGATTVATAATCVVQSAKENGCGYEETLEAMYHFLMDPAPYQKAEVKCTFGISGDACGSNKIVVEGLDTQILTQRAAFLRPDSTVVIVVLSDENDFSLKPAGLNWLPWGYGKGQMQHGWGRCADVPDDFEPETATDFVKLHTDFKCFSCFEDASDPNCKVPWATTPLNADVDGRNLRGFQQTKRFGYNFLWSRDRYVGGLTSSTIVGSDGKPGANPLFAGGRAPSNVIFAPIVGLPPSLVKGADGVPKATLSATEWSKLVGPIGTRDVHMVESIKPRAGVPRFAGDRTVDLVNGGDRDITDGDDLQYACITPRATTGPGNDCDGPSAGMRNPLCTSTGTQAYYKAFPGLRALRIAQSVNGYAASICDPALGNVLRGLVDRIKPLIK